MAENFHIAGDVEFSQLEGRVPHRYFRSNSGKIVDIWLGWKRGGLFQNEEKFEEKTEIFDFSIPGRRSNFLLKTKKTFR